MKNWLKKVLSLLTAIALLVSVAALAFAEESNEPIDITNAEEVSLNNNETSDPAAEEEAARIAAEQAAAEEAARKAAEEEAAQKAAEEEAARKAAEEEAARKAAEEEAARKAAEEEAARKAAEEEAARKAAEEAEQQDAKPVSSYYSDDETITDDEGTYPVADLFTFEDGDNGSVDDVTVEELGLVVTTEMKFPEATALNLNDIVTGTLDAETIGEYIIHWDSNRVIVLDLETSSDDVEVVINDKAVQFEKTEGSENNSTYGMMIAAEGEYHIVLTSSNPVSYTLTVKDAYAEATNTEATEANGEENNEGKNDENKQEGNTEIPEGTEGGNENLNNNEDETEGNGDIDGETNTDEETPEIEYPVIKGWITTDAETFEIGSTVILKAESDIELGDMTAWQTKVQNEDGEEVWKVISYGNELEVELTEETINNVYRFRMEYDNYSDEFSFIKEEETDETEGTEEKLPEGETEEEGTEETEQTEEGTEATEEVDEATKMAELGYTKIVVTAEEGADLYAAADKESEVTGHLDPETEAWVLMNEDQTWGQLYVEPAEEAEEAAEAVEGEAVEETAEAVTAPAQFICMEDAAEAVNTEEETEETEETEQAEEVSEEDEEAAKMAELGYIKIVVTAEEGADLYAVADRESEVTGHLDHETEAWVLLNEDKTWGQLYSEPAEEAEETAEAVEEEAAVEPAEVVTTPAQFICMEDAEVAVEVVEEVWYERSDLQIVMLDETGNLNEEHKAFVSSSADGRSSIAEGTMIYNKANVENIAEDETCEYQWYYSLDGGENWQIIEDATSEVYGYSLNYDTWRSHWMVIVTIHK